LTRHQHYIILCLLHQLSSIFFSPKNKLKQTYSIKHTNLIFFKEQTNLILISIKTNFPIIQLLNLKKVKKNYNLLFSNYEINVYKKYNLNSPLIFWHDIKIISFYVFWFNFTIFFSLKNKLKQSHLIKHTNLIFFKEQTT